MALHLRHCSAEINTAIREGLYVHMLEPALEIKDIHKDADSGMYSVAVGFRLRYEIVEIDSKHVIYVDHPDATNPESI